ncbi:hypothetical protein ABZ719_23370 [Streptomyces sp. NPDC006743]
MTATLGTPHHTAALRCARAELSRLPPLDLTELRDTAASRAVG